MPLTYRCICCLWIFLFGILIGAQTLAQAPIKPGRAVVYSVVLPGLGHKYANHGKWNRRAALYTITDIVLIAGVFTSEWQRRHLMESYQTWAASYAGVSTTGKDRRFYITIGNHLSSDDYREAQLRQRRIDLVGYVEAPEFQWTWNSIHEFQRYRDLRRSSESWSQHRGSFIAALAANRVLSAISALLTSRRERNRIPEIAIHPGPVIHLVLTL